jgi:phage shock protein A
MNHTPTEIAMWSATVDDLTKQLRKSLHENAVLDERISVYSKSLSRADTRVKDLRETTARLVHDIDTLKATINVTIADTHTAANAVIQLMDAIARLPAEVIPESLYEHLAKVRSTMVLVPSDESRTV